MALGEEKVRQERFSIRIQRVELGFRGLRLDLYSTGVLGKDGAA